MEINASLSAAAARLARLLDEKEVRIVFAESCTAGLVSAALGQVPGVSRRHCGSAVTYRAATKTAWLGIPPEEIEKHNVVSEHVARRMALGVLQITPEADLSAAITGHLGPDAPAALDGVIYIAIARRQDSGAGVAAPGARQLRSSGRADRQQEAAVQVLVFVCETLVDGQ